MAKTAFTIRHLLFEDLGLIDSLLRERGYEVRILEPGCDRLDFDITADDAARDNASHDGARRDGGADGEGAADGDLLVILGGPIGVADAAQYPFLADEIALLRRWIAAGRPVLGVCLGAQLIAAALGAAVNATGRTEIGYAPLELTADGATSVLAPLTGIPVLHWHGDQFEIPAGAVRLAATPGFPNQAFAIGDRVLGLQFHLEVEHEHIERWLIGHAAELAAAGVDPRALRADAGTLGPTLAAAARRVLDTWLDRLS